MDVLPQAALNLRRQSSEALGLLKSSFKYDTNPKVALAQISDWFANSTFDGITYGIPPTRIVEAADRENVITGRSVANGGVLIISPGRVDEVISESKKSHGSGKGDEARRDDAGHRSLEGAHSVQGSLPYESPRSPSKELVTGMSPEVGASPDRGSIVQERHVVKRKNITVNVDRTRRSSSSAATQLAPRGGTPGSLLQLVSRRLKNLQPEVLEVDVDPEMLVIRNRRQNSSRSIPLLKNEPGAKLTAVSSIWTDELQRYCIAVVTTSYVGTVSVGEQNAEQQTLWVIDVARALLLGRWVRPLLRHYCTRVSYASEGAVALLSADYSCIEIVLLPETETCTRMRLLAHSKLTLPISSLDTFTVSYRALAALAVCIINEGSNATMIGEIQAVAPESVAGGDGENSCARVSWYSGPLPHLDVKDAGDLNTEQLRAILTVAIGFDDKEMYCNALASWFRRSAMTEKLDLLQNDLLESFRAHYQQDVPVRIPPTEFVPALDAEHSSGDRARCGRSSLGTVAGNPIGGSIYGHNTLGKRLTVATPEAAAMVERHVPGRWRVDLIGVTWESVLFDVVYDEEQTAQALVKRIFTLATRGTDGGSDGYSDSKGPGPTGIEDELAEACEAYSAHQGADKLGDAIIMAALELHMEKNL